jgi:DNA-binding CsgD family transcriptional regulator/GAF domain-containing protein
MHLQRASRPEPTRQLRSDPLLTLLEHIHSSLRIEVLGARYVAGVRRLVPARAYAIYVFDPDTRRPTRLAQRGGVEPFMTRYEQLAFAYDPLLAHVDRTLEPVHDGQLFSEDDWQRQPLRQVLDARHLMHMLIAPLVLDRERIGSVFFTRRPDDRPFSADDLDVAGVLGRHLSLAVRNALLLRDAGDRARGAEGALEIMGSALVLTDRDGTLRFANRAAERLLRAPSLPAPMFQQALRENLSLLAGGDHEAVGRIAVGTGSRRLILRSRTLPGLDDRIATFLNQQVLEGEELRFSHLRGALAPRELQVLELLAQGLQNKQIAARLGISTHTVQYHLRRLFALMQVHSRAELLSKALER